jgi:hypothetical protein
MLDKIEKNFSRHVLHRGLDGFYEVFPRQSVLFEFPNGEWLGFCATCGFLILIQSGKKM